MSVSPKSLEFDAKVNADDPEQKKVSVTTNVKAWEIFNSSDWIKAGKEDDKTLSVSVTNTWTNTKEGRDAKIFIKAGSASDTVLVRQNAKIKDRLSLSAPSLSYGADDTAQKNMLQTLSGTLYVSESSATAGSWKRNTPDAYLSLSPTGITLPYNLSEGSATITTDQSLWTYSIVNAGGWLTVAQTGNRLSIHAVENTAKEERNAAGYFFSVYPLSAYRDYFNIYGSGHIKRGRNKRPVSALRC
ncbi:hypothetical protein FACS1894181_05580 [Bacteroidia bacterium]|nr:hypothetical protein FACS1894181_05580 [Bacteroidia bacterium]